MLLRHAFMHLAVLSCLLALGTGSRPVLGAAAATKGGWTPGSFPNPQKDLDACGRRGVASRICDPDGVLTLEGANRIEGAIQKIETGEEPYAAARCGDLGLRGYQIGVAVMRQMDSGHISGGNVAKAAKVFAKQLHDSWGVGLAPCSNGVLLLLATADRQIYISTGAGAKNLLSNEVLDAVINNMKPALRAQQYDEAVLEGVVDIGLALAGHELPRQSSDDGWGIAAFFMAVVASVFGWGWWSSRKQRRRYTSCKQKLAAIKAAQEAIRRGAHYAATSCPVCMEDFEGPGAGEGPSSSSEAAAMAGEAGPASQQAGDKHTRSSYRVPGVAGAGEESAALLGAGGSGSSGGSSGKRAAAGDGKSGTAAASEATRVPRRPLVLHCGHTFCEPCITQWCEKQSTCPVCRKDIRDDGNDDDNNDNGNAGDGNGPHSSSGQQARDARAMQDDLWLPELGFRLRRLRLLYPDYVTQEMVRQWEEDLAQHRALDTAAIRAFETRDPGRRQEYEQAGSGGSSSDWGGGSSYGGGGHGSSW